MKTNFWKSAAAFVVGMAAMVACEEKPIEPEVVAPVFPSEVTEKNVEAGETVELQFTANLDWELSIPATEQNKYWLDDAGMPASKVSGKAGDQTVSVVFSEDEYYDANVLCEVTLTMGGESKVIAKLTRLAINRSLEVYVAETSEWGFKKTYGTEKATALALTTFEGDVTYTLPIQVVANYDWSLALPEWCAGEIKGAESLSGKAGQAVEILLTGALAENVKNGAEGVAKFIDATDNTQSMDLPLTFPAFADRLEWSEPSSMEFDNTGASTSPAIGYVLAMDGYVVRALGWNGEWHDLAFADWVTITTEDASEGLLKSASVTFSVSENTGDDRAADIFVFPASMANTKAEDICNPNKCDEFNAPYAQYYVGRLTQKGAPKPFMSMVYPADYLEGEGVFYTDLQPKEDANIMQWDIEGAESYHKITYTGQWSYESGSFRINKPFATCKFYEDTQYPEGFFTKEVTPDWVSLWTNEDKSMGKFEMSYIPTSAIHVAAVFYDENGGKVAAVLVEYNPAGSAGSAATLSVVNGQAEVETLSSDSELSQYLASELSVSNVFEVTAKTAETTFEFSQSFVATSVFTKQLMPSSAVSIQTEGNFFKVTATESVEVIITLKDANYMNIAAIHYTYTPEGGGTAAEPTETLSLMSAYPGVTLSAITPTHELYSTLYGMYNTPNMWSLEVNNQSPMLSFSTSITSVEVLDMSLTATTVPFVQAMGTMMMIQAPSQQDVSRIILLKSGSEVVGVIYYYFTF